MAVRALRAATRQNVIPGLNLNLGIALFVVGVVVVVPLAFVVLEVRGMTLAQMASSAWSPRALRAYALTFGTSAIGAGVASVAGLLVAIVLVRYRFFGRAVLDVLADIPLALPTAVAGIALATIYAPLHLAYTPIGITIALIFVGIPFTVRTVVPALEQLPAEYEEIAQTLDCGPLEAFARVIVPLLLPSVLVGYALALARALGEYGSVVFIAGNIPNKTEIASVLIVARLEEYDYSGAALLAIVMLIASGALILCVNALQRVLRRRTGVA